MFAFLRVRFLNWGRSVRPWLSTNFRIVEAAGLMVMAATAALEYRSIRSDERLLSGQNAELIADWSVWTTAMPQHMHWLEYAAEQIPKQDNTLPPEQDRGRRFNAFLTNYVVYITTANMLLREQRGSLRKFELDAGLGNTKRIRDCDDAVQRVIEDTGAFSTGKLSTGVSTKSSSEDLERFAKNLGESSNVDHVGQAAKACAHRREYDLKALAERKEHRATFYIYIFLVGSLLLGIGKYGNWLDDRDRARK